MSTVGDGLYQYGGVPVGSSFAGYWGSQVWFVDGDNGNDGQSGKKPTNAFATIAKAVTEMAAGDTIYVRPRVPKADASDQEVYEENQIIPYAKHSVSIIGTTNAGSVYGPKVRSDSSGYVFDVYAPSTRIENLSIHRMNSNGGTGGVYLRGSSTWTAIAGSAGSMISNCHIRYCAEAEKSGVYIQGGHYFPVIQNCTFTNCDTNITIDNATGGIGRGAQVIGCNFMSHSGSAETVDPMVRLVGPMSEFLMKYCHFDQATLLVDANGAVDGIVSACNFHSSAAVVPSAGGTAADEGTGALRFIGCMDASQTIVDTV